MTTTTVTVNPETGRAAYRRQQQQIARLLVHLTQLPEQECFPTLLRECATNPILLRTRLVDVVQAVFHVKKYRALTVVSMAGKQWDGYQGKYSLATMGDVLNVWSHSDRFVIFLMTCLREFDHLHAYVPDGFPFSVLHRKEQDK